MTMLHIRTLYAPEMTACGLDPNDLPGLDTTVFVAVPHTGQDELAWRHDLDTVARQSDCPACRAAYVRWHPDLNVAPAESHELQSTPELEEHNDDPLEIAIPY